jgi:hypothetical protein
MPKSTSRGRRGIWKLLVLLGLVMLMMRQLGRPEAAVLLGHMLGMTGQAERVEAEPSPPNPADNSPAIERHAAAEGQLSRSEPVTLGGEWDAVKDNAMFSEEEQPAWFSLLEQVRQTPPEELAGQTVDVAYAQLANQPDAYRTKAVRVRGRVLRESVKRAPANDLGIESYHQLWLAPVGGGDLPMAVYSLELPAGFPRGDKIAADVTVNGLFFKNWTFAYDGGMGIAPVIVTRSVDWNPPVIAKPRAAALETRWAIIGVAVAALAAVGFLAWVIRQTHRPRITRSAAPLDFSQLEGP